MSIHNIIFDFGGVIIRIDHLRLENNVRELANIDLQSLFTQNYQLPLFCDFEKGLISSSQFKMKLLRIVNLNLKGSEFNKLWNSLIIGYSEDIIDLMKKIKCNYRTFILSNTNTIHYKYFSELYKSDFNKELEYLVEYSCWSFKTGLRKPDKSIFIRLVNSLKLNPEETLFIDDTLANIITAKNLNFITYLVTKDNELLSLFDKNGYLISPDSLMKQSSTLYCK